MDVEISTNKLYARKSQIVALSCVSMRGYCHISSYLSYFQYVIWSRILFHPLLLLCLLKFSQITSIHSSSLLKSVEIVKEARMEEEDLASSAEFCYSGFINSFCLQMGYSARRTFDPQWHGLAGCRYMELNFCTTTSYEHYWEFQWSRNLAGSIKHVLPYITAKW